MNKNQKLSAWRKTKNGLISNMYSNQKNNSKRRGHNPPLYSFCEFKEWVLSKNEFHSLYDFWVLNNYDKRHTPSVDRKDDYIGYCFDNIQITNWESNSKKFGIDMINGINTKQCKSVLQYDFNGNFIKEFYSIAQASRETKINGILGCVSNNPIKSAGGFVWKYKNGNIESKISKFISKNKRVSQYSIDGIFIKTFNSIIEASNECNINDETIIKNCQGKIKFPKKFIWKYED